MSRSQRLSIVRLAADAASPATYSRRRVRHPKVRGPDRDCGRRRRPCRPRASGGGPMNSHQDHIADAINYEAAVVANAQKSTRNHVLNRAAFKLGTIPGMPSDTVVDVLL